MANAVQFGYLKESSIASKIQAGIINEYDIIVEKDGLNRMWFVKPDLELLQIRSDIHRYDTLQSAIEDINKRKDVYAGEIIAIKGNGNYSAYIVNKSGNSFIATPLSSGGVINYNELEDKPIINKVGSIANPIIIEELEAGKYSIKGEYKLKADDDTTNLCLSSQLFQVDEFEGDKVVKHIANSGIKEYRFRTGVVEIGNYITDIDLKGGMCDVEEIHNLFK